MTSEIPVPHPAPEHSVMDDALGILCGTVVVSVALFLLRAGGVVTGGTAGLTLLLDYTTPLPFGPLFLLVNLPFFALAIRGKGWGFVLRSGLAIALVSAFASFHAIEGIGVLGDIALNPFYAATIGAVVAAVGIIILFRHGASMGGFNIIGLILQERFGLRAGYVMLVGDAAVVLSSLAIAPWPVLAASALGVVVMNVVIAVNHRPGRYVAVPRAKRRGA
ncbi:membrane protein [Microbacterium faecale]|uniref:Membrane protein n=1 Tax=Microbacterium faecale TaxID=1804630 RepID=A0A916Y0C2_9MICO|nr:YitT family protein [Microbacterium faecale]GGD25387.1 membrane protein [Microbacterium faecale]